VVPCRSPARHLPARDGGIPARHLLKDGKPSGTPSRDMVREIAADRASRTTSPDVLEECLNMALSIKVVLSAQSARPSGRPLPVGGAGRKNNAILMQAGLWNQDSRLMKPDRCAIGTTTNWFTEQHLKREGFSNLLSYRTARNVRQLMNGEVQLSNIHGHHDSESFASPATAWRTWSPCSPWAGRILHRPVPGHACRSRPTHGSNAGTTEEGWHFREDLSQTTCPTQS